MKRRKTVVAAAFCVSFCLGTLMNVLFVPGFESHQTLNKAGRHYINDAHPPRLRANEFAPITGANTEPEAATTGGMDDLQSQIRDRLDEVLRYRSRSEDAADRPLDRRRLMDLERPSRRDRYQERSDEDPGRRTTSSSGGSPARLDCGSLESASSLQFVGSGYTKAVYRAELNHSLSVALKSVDLAGHDMESCVKRYGSAEDCYRLAAFKIIKEMTLMERLQHPNILTVNRNPIILL